MAGGAGDVGGGVLGVGDAPWMGVSVCRERMPGKMVEASGGVLRVGDTL